MSEKGFRVEIPVNIKRDRRARRVLATGESPDAKEAVPRIARLLALAHKWEDMVRRGEVSGYAEIALRCGLSRARVGVICKLTLLAPDVQGTLLQQSHRLQARLVRSVIVADWEEQRRLLPQVLRS